MFLECTKLCVTLDDEEVRNTDETMAVVRKEPIVVLLRDEEFVVKFHWAVDEDKTDKLGDTVILAA